MIKEMEIRGNDTLQFNEKTLSVEGLVNKTDCWSNVLGNRKKFREKVSKGAFARAIQKAASIDFLYDHNRSCILSSTDNGSLDLWEDDEGLQMRAAISKTSYGKDAYELIKDKIINHMSFGFKVIKDKWNIGLDGVYERVIEELQLLEVSAVRNPAYSQSAIEARGIDIIEDLDNKYIKIEERGINNMMTKKELYETVGDNKGNGIKNMKSTPIKNVTLADTTVERLSADEVLSKCKIKVVDNASGKVIFPLITEEKIDSVEVKAEAIDVDVEVSGYVYNDTPNADDVYKTHTRLKLNKKVHDKLAKSLGEVEVIGNEVTDLFTINPKYVEDNYIMMNKVDFEKVAKMKFDDGKPILKYERLNGRLVPCINNVPILINENINNKIVLFTPKYIGVASILLQDVEEVIITEVRRRGNKLFRASIGAETAILDKDSVRAIALA